MKQHFKQFVRRMKNSPSFFFINLGGLVVGMTTLWLILGFVQFESSFDNFHNNVENVFRVESKFYEGNVLTDDWATSSPGYASAMKENFRQIESFVRIERGELEQIVQYKEHKYRENRIVYTDSTFFDFFNFQILKGSAVSLKSPNKVVITESIANKYFPKEEALGKMLTLRGDRTLHCEVGAVIENIPKNSHFDYDIFLSWETMPEWKQQTWYVHESYSYVKLLDGTNPKTIESAFPKMSEKYKTLDALRNKTWAIELMPLPHIHLAPQKQYEGESKGNKTLLYTLFIVGVLIMLIAWINYMNLSSTKSMERAKELGVKKVCGSSSNELRLQFILESVFLNTTAFICSIGFFFLLKTPFSSMLGENIELHLFTSLENLILSVVSIFVGSIVVSFYPAFVLSSFSLRTVLTGSFNHSSKGRSLRNGFVVFQFVASIGLIIASGVIYQQTQFMQNQPLGVSVENTLVVKYPAQTEDFDSKLFDLCKSLETQTPIKSFTRSGSVPGYEVATFLSNHLFHDQNKQNKLYEMLPIDGAFLTFYDMELLAGRSFYTEEKTDLDKLIINEASMKALGFTDPEKAVGELVLLETLTKPHEIVGVVKDYHQEGLNKSTTPIMMLKIGSISWIAPKYISLKLSPSFSAKSIDDVHAKWKQYFPESTFDTFFLDVHYEKQYSRDRRFQSIIFWFTGVALLIACVGLWVLAKYSNQLRTVEIGVRRVHGASEMEMLQTLIVKYVRLVILSFFISAPIVGLAMYHWLQSYAYRTTMSPWVFVLAGVLGLCIAVATVSYHTWKTTRKNPVDALRYE